MKKINSMKRRKNGLKKTGSPRNGEAVLSYPAPYRKLKQPCPYCGSIIKAHNLRYLANGQVRRESLTKYCSPTCFDLYCHAAADDQYRYFTMTEKVDQVDGSRVEVKIDVIVNGSLVREIP